MLSKYSPAEPHPQPGTFTSASHELQEKFYLLNEINTLYQINKYFIPGFLRSTHKRELMVYKGRSGVEASLKCKGTAQPLWRSEIDAAFVLHS